jgi:CO/xanthine dehydrogenase Mo-binding subunit
MRDFNDLQFFAAVVPTSAALANAFAHATGRRLRELPMTPERVMASLF